MTTLTLTGTAIGPQSIYCKTVTKSLVKTWTINSVATTSNSRTYTNIVGAVSIGTASFTVSSSSGFRTKDQILITGNSSGVFQSETQTISSIAGNVITISGTMIHAYDSGADVIKNTRLINYDFSNTRWTIKVSGTLEGTDINNLNTQAGTLEAMFLYGGTIKAVFTYLGWAYQDTALTSLTIDKFDEDGSFHYAVDLTLEIVGKEL